jgi:tRNA nucleotidyltransferase (CCA-adding enzyme)
MIKTHNNFITIDKAHVYLVGGALRDELLGRTYTDHDWVVVGANPEIMLKKKFKRVGMDFPVFLHPDTHEEYALARIEKKTGFGYKDFEFDFNEHITLNDDLARRDLTINAIAQDHNGEIYDPFNGIADIKNRILRHVTHSFTEDPVRILRIARFSAQMAPYGFTIANETYELIQDMIHSGCLKHLTSERVWLETTKSLSCSHPQVFIKTLHHLNALDDIYPELNTLFGIPQTPHYHPEIDSGIHTLMVMEQSALLSTKTTVRFAAMMHDIGKGMTPKSLLPKHHNHEIESFNLLKNIYKRLPVPKNFQVLANNVAKYHLHTHRAFELKPSTILKLFKHLDAYRKPVEFDDFLLCCLADSQGRTNYQTREFPQIDFLKSCFQASQSIQAQMIFDDYSEKRLPRPEGKMLGDLIDRQRLASITQIKEKWATT